MTKSPAAIPRPSPRTFRPPGCRSPFCLSAPRRRGRRTMSRPFREKVDRLQQQLSDLERQVYNGQAPAGGGAAATGGVAANQEVRLQQLESQVSTLTGQIEELRNCNPAALRPHGQNVAGHRLPPERSGAWAGRRRRACRRRAARAGAPSARRSAAAAEPAAGPADAAAATGQSQSALDAVVPGARDPGNADPEPIAIGECPAGAGCCGDGRGAGRDGPHRRDHPAARQFGRGAV